MSEKKIVDTFDGGKLETLSIEFLAHVVESALSCDAAADDLPVRLALAASARACLDHYTQKKVKIERDARMKAALLENAAIRQFIPAGWLDELGAPESPPEWVAGVIDQINKANGP